MDEKYEFEIIRPDDPRYKELVSQTKDKGVSLVGGLHIVEGMLAECKKRKKTGAKTTIPGLATDRDGGEPARPIDERIAELEKMVEEAKEVIEWAETKRPGSSRTENGSLLMQEYDEEKRKQIMPVEFDSFLKDSFKKSMGLETYFYLKDNLYKTDVSTDKTFQTTYNSFYNVRRNEEWRKVYYKYFEKIKNKKDISFEEIINYLFKHTGNIEASFSSKLLSTINPEMPILDQFVLQNLRIKIEATPDKKVRLKNAIKAYNSIIEKEKELLAQKDVQKFVEDFKKFLPEYELTDIRILDYLLWGTRA